MRILGIDPGKQGALAFLDGGDVEVAPIAKRTLRELHHHLTEWQPDFAILEKVSSSPQMGVKSAFSFGQCVGQLEALLSGAGVPFDRVTPQKWQRSMQCMSGGDKNVTKTRAAELFPAIKMTHAIADALLIAEYGRRLKAGEL